MSSSSHTESKDPTPVIAIIHGELTCNSSTTTPSPFTEKKTDL